jgi:hypothetical protein
MQYAGIDQYTNHIPTRGRIPSFANSLSASAAFTLTFFLYHETRYIFAGINSVAAGAAFVYAYPIVPNDDGLGLRPLSLT